MAWRGEKDKARIEMAGRNGRLWTGKAAGGISAWRLINWRGSSKAAYRKSGAAKSQPGSSGCCGGLGAHR
jgi:hypothetical protein